MVAIEKIDDASSPLSKPWKLLGLVVEGAASKSARVRGSWTSSMFSFAMSKLSSWADTSCVVLSFGPEYTIALSVFGNNNVRHFSSVRKGKPGRFL